MIPLLFSILLISSQPFKLYDSFIFIPGYDFPTTSKTVTAFPSVWNSSVGDFTSMISGVKNHCIYADRIYRKGNLKYAVNAKPCLSSRSLKYFILTGTGPDFSQITNQVRSFPSESRIYDGGYQRWSFSEKKLFLKYRFNRSRKTSLSFEFENFNGYLFLNPTNKTLFQLENFKFFLTQKILLTPGKSMLFRFNDRGQFRFLHFEIIEVTNQTILFNYSISSRGRILSPGLSQLFKWDISPPIFRRRILKILELKLHFILEGSDLGFIDEFSQFLYISEVFEFPKKEKTEFHRDFSVQYQQFLKKFTKRGKNLLQAGSLLKYSKVNCIETDLSLLPDDISVAFSGDRILLYTTRPVSKRELFSFLPSAALSRSFLKQITGENLWIVRKSNSYFSSVCYRNRDFVGVKHLGIKLYTDNISLDNIFQIRYLMKKHFYTFK